MEMTAAARPTATYRANICNSGSEHRLGVNPRWSIEIYRHRGEEEEEEDISRRK